MTIEDQIEDDADKRARMLGRIFAAHALGLSISGMIVTGFSPLGLPLGLLIGGLSSIPWMIALLALVFFCGTWLERHPFVFAICGPLAVVFGFVVAGSPMLTEVAISCIASSATVLILTLWRQLDPMVEHPMAHRQTGA